MTFAFTPENQNTFNALLTRYPTKKAALLPTLWLAQKQHGSLPLDVQKEVAKLLDLSSAHVYGVVSFYTMFKEKPCGKYHLQICRTLSCALAGSEVLINQVKQKLSLEPNQVSADGLFSLELVECLASCGTAPALAINDTLAENVNEEKLNKIINELKNR